MSKNYMKLVSEAYREASKYPSLVSAYLESISQSRAKAAADVLHVSTTWSQTNLATYQTAKFSRPYTIAADAVGVHDGAAMYVGEPVPAAAADLSLRKNGVRCLVRTGTEKDEQFVEVWGAGLLRQSYNLKDIDAHGKIYTDQDFGSLDISADSTRLVYIAEKKVQKSLPFLHQGEVADGVQQGTAYNYRQDWGEQLVGKIEPAIAVLDLQTIQPAQIQMLTSVPDGWSPGLVRFWNSGIVGVAYRTTPRKLGKVYCSNRVAELFFIDAEGIYKQLRSTAGEDEEIGISCLTVNGETGRLVWFERTLFKNKLYPGPHLSAMRIMGLQAPDGEPYEIFSENQPVFQGDLKKSCGIFSETVPARCWLDQDSLIISCVQGGTVVPVLINCQEKTVTVLVFLLLPSPYVLEPSNEGVTVLDVYDGYVLGVSSQLHVPPHLVVARTDALVFHPVSAVSELDHLTLERMSFGNPPHFQDVNFPYSAWFLSPKGVTDAPLIVWPHGGPHSVVTSSFSNTVLFFSSLGFSVLLVNYRGSTGFGEENVRSLLGRVGDMDVKDCDYARQMCLEEHPYLSPNKVFLLGGSHGGFLVTHLAGQYPDNYRGVVARNPVTNIASMCEVTDIPDWTYNEAGLEYSWLHPSPALYQEMFARSPISQIEKIKAPIFLMIGKEDLRVPPSQGLQFYHSLKALGKDVRMQEYADNHPLAKPQHDANVMISAAIFFNDILNPL